MKIDVISFFYNEEFLTPLFCRHYKYARTIKVFLDSDTNDATRELLCRFPNVQQIEYKFPDGMDDILKVQRINKCLLESTDADWQIVVDSDEFVWPSEREMVEELEKIPSEYNAIIARMWNVYRHVSDSPIDRSMPPKWQRRHGIPERAGAESAPWSKPAVIRAGYGFQYCPGNHAIIPNPKLKIADVEFDGAHWAMADPCFCVDRRVQNRRKRQSQVNLSLGLTTHHHHCTEETVLNECLLHENDPQVF